MIKQTNVFNSEVCSAKKKTCQVGSIAIGIPFGRFQRDRRFQELRMLEGLCSHSSTRLVFYSRRV